MVVPNLSSVIDMKNQEAIAAVNVEFEKDGERYVYEVKFRDKDGGVWELYFDAVTGELVKRGRED